MPPALVKLPATQSRPLKLAMLTPAALPPARPMPSADQLAPSHLAIPEAGIPPAWVKVPPAYSSPLWNPSPYTVPLTPALRADHVDPSQSARFVVNCAPQLVKSPPT